MKGNIALFISDRSDFFKEEANIDCPVSEYCACDGANILFDVDSVMRQKLIDVGQGIKMSEPLKVDKQLSTGKYIFASLSQRYIIYFRPQRYHPIITDLNNNRQVKIDVENISLSPFTIIKSFY